jgi:hypothetical protein
MTLSEIASFTTALSGIAVTISVVYLALQTHQNARHTRALILQARIGAIAQSAHAATDASLAAAILAAEGIEPTLQNVQQAQFTSFCAARFYGWQDTFRQYEDGMLDRDFYLQMRQAIATFLAKPSWRTAWQTIRIEGTRFSDFVDDIVAAQTAAVSHDSKAV